ncbi:plakophilin-3-like isoform X2 [Plectropomus leopardus]|uniref:plakophilin-3-like isoform X2 n=1 Tax=Plectropomus leopardus TaxID=160734 RepID=UPI001C4C1B48|nr:plakophilin-3-like isoform X2 [Plectropomus leopardus]
MSPPQKTKSGYQKRKERKENQRKQAEGKQLLKERSDHLVRRAGALHQREEHLQINAASMPNASVTTYGLPDEFRLGNGGSMSDEMARAQRVQQQVKMRMSQQKGTLPRQNGQYAMSDYGGSSTMKYSTYHPSYSSKSFMYSGSKTLGPRASQRSGFSCQSAGPDLAQLHRMSAAGGGGGGSFYREDFRSYHGGARPQSHIEHDLSVGAVRQHTALMNPWATDGSDACSMVSERDATLNRQYAHSAINGYTSHQVRQGEGTMSFMSPMRRSLSGTLTRGGGMSGGEVEVIQQHHAFKGPAQRTINRIASRNKSIVQQPGSIYGIGMDKVDRGFITSGVSSDLMRQNTLSRAMSMKSVQSVGRGMDVSQGQMELGILKGFPALDMPTAVQNLRESDHDLQALGAAYIQHQCYHDSDSKNQVRELGGITDLVKLFNCENQEVQCYATGATRNLIYENMDNKVALIREGGIPQLVEALKEDDDELQKNITGILWNLSSKDNLKEKLARETLPDLTERILIPMTGGGETEGILQSASEAEIFYNTTGCLRNMSSVNEDTRQLMRGTHGLVDSLVGYIKASLEDNKNEDKGVENAMCVLRNLSYQLYSEMPPSAMMRLEGPTRDQDSGKGDAIGCFTPQSRKAKNTINQDLSTFTEVARVPKGVEWLWHPQIVGVYGRVLRQCEINSTTREAAAGALQNITAGDKRWASVLSRVALEQERLLPVVMDLLRTNKDLELRSLTGLLRNMSRHARDKNDMSTKVVNSLLTKLPDNGHQKEPSSDVVVNICGVLNNLVTSSQVAARDITFFDGLPKLVGIKSSHDNSSGKTKAAKAAATVLSNMFQYKKLHRDYKAKGFTRPDFADMMM